MEHLLEEGIVVNVYTVNGIGLATPDALLRVVSDPGMLAIVWANDQVLAALCGHLCNTGLLSTVVMDTLLRKVKSRRDLQCILIGLPTSTAEEFMDATVRSGHVSDDVIAACVASPTAFAGLPNKGGWIGHAIYVRGCQLLKQEDPKLFELEDLLPLGIDVDLASSRALLSAAAESGRLSSHAFSIARARFPQHISFRQHKVAD